VRIVAVSDLHLDWTTMGVSRFDEVSRALSRATCAAVEWNADLFVCCGDVCDPDSGSVVLRCAKEIVSAATYLRHNGIASAWVCGNHDVAGDGRTTSLDPLLGLTTIPASDVMVFRDRPSLAHFKGWQILGLPYPSSPKGWTEPISDASKFSEKLKTIVLGHLSIEGVQPGEEADEMARGKDCFWPVEETKKLNPALQLGGHYHRRQATREGIQIVGSLARLTFAAEEHRPGFLCVEVDG
jgi:DNA repair exonuclease SbcCD nuclease subunit